MQYDVIIIGAGAGGLMCYHQLENQNVKVLLIDKNKVLGRKLLLTGNGRCNVTNNLSPKDFIQRLSGKQPKFFYKASHAFSTRDIVDFFANHGLDLKLEEGFKYFPVTNKASDILKVLIKNQDKDDIRTEEEVLEIKNIDNYYQLTTNKNQYQSKRVVIATGSNSYPKTGSTGDGVSFAHKFGLKTHPFYPAETKVFSTEVSDLPLQGTSLTNVSITIEQTKHQANGDLLFTHDGLSGPVIYHLSEYIYHKIKEQKKAFIRIDFLGETYEEYLNELKEHSQKILETFIAKKTSKRFASTLFAKFELPKKPIKDLSDQSKKWVYDLFANYRIQIDRVEDKTLAYVNGGGVLTNQLNPSTMECKNHKGLYFIGETIDVHGPIGGFNISIAFATAYLAAKHIREETNA